MQNEETKTMEWWLFGLFFVENPLTSLGWLLSTSVSVAFLQNISQSQLTAAKSTAHSSGLKLSWIHGPCKKNAPVCRMHSFLQGVSAAASPVLAIVGKPSVRPSVCPSVTRWHWVKTTQARITKSSPTDSPRILAFGIKNSFRNSKGFTPSEGVKWEWGRENSQPYLRNGAR